MNEDPSSQSDTDGPEHSGASNTGGDVIRVNQQPHEDPDRLRGPRWPGFTETASQCLMKAVRLASELNHPQVAASHLIAAMTLVPRANRQFAYKSLDPEIAWKASMEALIHTERVNPGSSSDPPPSAELTSILSEARKYAETRDDQDTSVDDILGALSKSPLEMAGRKLVSGLRLTTPAEEARDAIFRLDDRLTRRLDALLEALKGSKEPAQNATPQGSFFRTLTQFGGRKSER